MRNAPKFWVSDQRPLDKVFHPPAKAIMPVMPWYLAAILGRRIQLGRDPARENVPAVACTLQKHNDRQPVKAGLRNVHEGAAVGTVLSARTGYTSVILAFVCGRRYLLCCERSGKSIYRDLVTSPHVPH
jgi:hypothetical protein